MTDEKKKTGRKSGYKPEYDKQAAKLCKLGATGLDLADFFDVCEKTIYNWCNEHPAFKKAVSSGKDYADEKVERALYHRAVGYEHEDTHFSAFNGVVTKTSYMKHIVPEVKAQIFWLKNRKPDEWKDRIENQLSGAIDVNSLVAGRERVNSTEKPDD